MKSITIMNENIDLTKILEGCPAGTEFYHAGYGRIVYFERIILNSDCPIRCLLSNCRPCYANIAVTKKGAINALYEGECLLFPSKDQRDWSKFERFWDKPKVEKFDPKTFQPFDKILVRDNIYSKWHTNLFSYFDSIRVDYHIEAIETCYRYAIPYNEDTKHLVGTTDDCPEYYKWWEE